MLDEYDIFADALFNGKKLREGSKKFYKSLFLYQEHQYSLCKCQKIFKRLEKRLVQQKIDRKSLSQFLAENKDTVKPRKTV